MKKLITFVKPILRGAIKTVPFGNAAIEIGTSIKEAIQSKKDPLNSTTPTHDWKSMLTQVVILGIIVYAFATKMITIDQVMQYLGVK